MLLSVHCCLVVTCWERADLLALVGDVYCIFDTFLCGILGQVWHLIVSFPDLCLFSYFYKLSYFFLPFLLLFFSSFFVLTSLENSHYSYFSGSKCQIHNVFMEIFKAVFAGIPNINPTARPPALQRSNTL